MPTTEPAMPKPDPAGYRILELLPLLGEGGVEDEINHELKAVIAACRATGKAGTITVKLKLSPATDRHGNVNQIQFQTAVTSAKPSTNLGDSLFYLTKSGELTDRDPRQPGLFEDPSRRARIREIGSDN